MAEAKNSFVLYTDLIEVVRKLPKQKRGDFFMHILEYVNDLNPETKDILIQVAFEPVRQQLKRDLVKWRGSKVSQSDAGRLGNIKRWHPDLYRQIEDKSITLEQAESIALSLKTSGSDKNNRTVSGGDEKIAVTVTVPVTVTESVNVIKEEEQNEILPPAPKKETNILPINTYRKIKHLILSNEEFEKLAVNYSKEQIDDILDAIENYKDNKKYTSLFFTANKWLKKEYPANSKTYHQPQDKQYF